MCGLYRVHLNSSVKGSKTRIHEAWIIPIISFAYLFNSYNPKSSSLPRPKSGIPLCPVHHPYLIFRSPVHHTISSSRSPSPVVKDITCPKRQPAPKKHGAHVFFFLASRTSICTRRCNTPFAENKKEDWLPNPQYPNLHAGHGRGVPLK
jgi:hypothetical protein